MTDTERLDFLEARDVFSKHLLQLGSTHYWRKGYNKSYKRAESLRDAVDKVMEYISAKGL